MQKESAAKTRPGSKQLEGRPAAHPALLTQRPAQRAHSAARAWCSTAAAHPQTTMSIKLQSCSMRKTRLHRPGHRTLPLALLFRVQISHAPTLSKPAPAAHALPTNKDGPPKLVIKVRVIALTGHHSAFTSRVAAMPWSSGRCCFPYSCCWRARHNVTWVFGLCIMSMTSNTISGGNRAPPFAGRLEEVGSSYLF